MPFLSQFTHLSLPKQEDPFITHLTLDSRTCRPGSCFFAVPGTKQDGRQFIQQALHQKASAILYEDEQANPICALTNLPKHCFPIPHLVSQISHFAAKFYQDPSEKLFCVGVTGTNGKSSVCHFLAQAWQLLGLRAGLLGTLGNGLWPHIIDRGLTTADPITLQQDLAALCEQGASHVALEVSSHGLNQQRVEAIAFRQAIFTNISHEHLDYHGTMENYFAAKARLFTWPSLQQAIINLQNTYGKQLLGQAASHCQTLTYGSINADIACLQYQPKAQGSLVTLRIYDQVMTCNLDLMGIFQIENLQATIASLLGQGITSKDIINLLPLLRSPPGRLEIVCHKPTIIIDYAHTPDGLQATLQALRPHTQKGGRLILLFGCGGDRDRSKRPKMARIAETLADQVIITSDNPRFEAPEQIKADIFSGFSHPETISYIAEREEAICHAISQLHGHDILLLAGKGHERHQSIQGQKIPFDEREIIFKATN